MPAYLVVYARVTDPVRFKAYATAALPLIERFGGSRIAISQPMILEGEASWRGAAIYEWPNRESALAFWHSPEYVEVRRLREGAAELHATLIDGEVG
jgi:uncharacterized protein (DUF1330 family)